MTSRGAADRHIHWRTYLHHVSHGQYALNIVHEATVRNAALKLGRGEGAHEQSRKDHHLDAEDEVVPHVRILHIAESDQET